MELILSRIMSTKGQAAAVLNLLLAVFVVLVIAVFCFELSRYFLARDQLKAATEAAALCCETTLVSAGAGSTGAGPTDPTNQGRAVTTAITLFQQNSILGKTISSTAQTGNIIAPGDLAPDPGQAQICFTFQAPPGGATSGAVIKATSAYCYTPAFGQFIGLGKAQFTFQVSAFSGVPRIDVVIAFDVSGYQDLFTPGAPIQRGGPPNNTNTGGPTTTTTTTTTTSSGGSGGGTCAWAWGEGLRYMAPQTNTSGPLTGCTIADIVGHVGNAGTQAMHCLPPLNYDAMNSTNFSNSITWSELSQNSSTNTLMGFNGNTATPAFSGVVPGNVCCLPPPTGTTSYLDNHAKKTNLIASTKAGSSENLQQLCAAVNASVNKKITSSRSLQLDDILKTIAFLPPAYAGCMGMNNNCSSSSSSTGTSSYPPYLYTVDNQTYYGGSHTNTSAPDGQPNYTPTVAPIPGNCPSGSLPSTVAAGSSVNSIFTHFIVNPDGQTQFSCNWTDPTNQYYFYDQSTVLEAFLGNLENQTAAQNALVDTKDTNVTPQNGYAAAYYTNAYVQLQPLQAMLNAASALIYEMKNVADVHFSFIAFNDSAGNASTGTNAALYSSASSAPATPSGYPSTDCYVPMISSLFPYAAPTPTAGQTATYICPSLPFIPLDPSTPSGSDPDSAHTDLISLLPQIQPYGNRNVSAGLAAALTQFQTNGRAGVNQAIVLFCSGAPTEASKTNAVALDDAITQAGNANSSTSGTHIPIFCVTVADPLTTPVTNGASADDSADDAAYSDTSVGGLCYTAAPGPGIGHRYCRVDWAGSSSTQSNLSSVVDYIVRQMVNMAP